MYRHFRINFITDRSKLPPPKKHTAASVKQHNKSGPSALLNKANNVHLQSLNSRSMVPAGSPTTLGASPKVTQQTQAMPSTSSPVMPDSKMQRLDAIRYPLLHILATRPMSANFLHSMLKCPKDDLLEVLKKVGKESRLDPSKWDLKDQSYRQLDIWKFKFQDPQDRDIVIQRCVSAFDRMRMSQEDPAWQQLYAKADRNKGNTLSRMSHLAKGTIQQGATPRIHVEQADDQAAEMIKKGDEGDRKGGLTPTAAEPMARSKSDDSGRKNSKASEKTIVSKRGSSNDSKDVELHARSKSASVAAKKAGSKRAAAAKSAEFVHDSDEEDESREMPHDSPPGSSQETATKPAGSAEDVPLPITNGASHKKHDSSTPQRHHSSKKIPPAQERGTNVKTAKSPQTISGRIQKPATAGGKAHGAPFKSKVVATEKKAEPGLPAAKVQATATMTKKVPKSPAPTPGASKRLSESSGINGNAMQKSLSRQRTGSSPIKPSPLGSSPPTNASEFEKSAYNSPPSSTPSSPPSASGKAAGFHYSVTHSGSSHSSSTTPSSPKRNGYGSAHTPSSSDASLKRKANDLDSGIHDHKHSLANGLSDPSYPTSGRVLHDPHKRQKREAESDSSTSPLSEREVLLQEAQRFKALHERYAKVHGEVSSMRDPPLEKVQHVNRMHSRLVEMKRSICKGFSR